MEKNHFSHGVTDNTYTPISPLYRIEPMQNTPFKCIQIFRNFALGKAKDENFVFSPCSIQLALSLITNGATGSTLEVLLKFLEAENQEQLTSHASKLISSLTESAFTQERKPFQLFFYPAFAETVRADTSNNGPELSFVGGVWVDQSMNLTTKFKTDAEILYKAKAETVDFAKRGKEIVKTVNQWAAESTNGLIPSLLPEGFFNEQTRLALANALYFKGKWADPFKKERTKDLPFYMQGGDSVNVPFMTNSSRQYIKTFENLKVLKLPYSNSSLSMYILLPHERDGLGALVEEVSSDVLFLGKYTRVQRDVLVKRFRVPKFKIDYKFDASEVLKSMGLELCFTSGAEFSDMVVGGGIEVQTVYHGSHIEVEEDGTKAAASTCISMGLMCSSGYEPPPEVPIDFVADHPFMYLVKDDKSGMVLFMGHVVNPLLENSTKLERVKRASSPTTKSQRSRRQKR